MKQFFISPQETVMYRQYRSSSLSARIVAAAAAVVTVLWLFDFVATLGEVTTKAQDEVHASV